MQGEIYRLVIIANAGTKLPFIPENTSKSDALKMITFDCSGAWNATDDTNCTLIPMWGETESATVINENITLGITLLRALARIDVGCDLSGETAKGLNNFTLTSVKVYRVNDKGYVAPLAASLNTGSVGVKDVSIPGSAAPQDIPSYSVSDGKSLIRSVYVTETAAGTTKDKVVCLVVGGIYEKSTNYYRVDFVDKGNYIPIKRNCRYVVNITGVSAAG
ncbi:MAG: hypothetical protein LUE99_13895, partial [Bacteroides sp.]|nr:hypothetical protein [Bacteroides sp.]